MSLFIGEEEERVMLTMPPPNLPNSGLTPLVWTWNSWIVSAVGTKAAEFFCMIMVGLPSTKIEDCDGMPPPI
jgi:hypothetical protein